MKVKCVNCIRLDNGIPYRNLTKEKEYIVLTIEFFDSASVFSQSIGDFVLYRIEGDDGVVVPFPAKLFAIVSNKIPASWVSYRRADSSFTISPESWATPFFWEDYYNSEPFAMNVFNIERQEMYALESM